jgi:hypothetical protein
MDHDAWRVAISFPDQGQAERAEILFPPRKVAAEARRRLGYTIAVGTGGTQVSCTPGQRPLPGRLSGSPATYWLSFACRQGSSSIAGIPVRNGGTTRTLPCRGPRPSARRSTSGC